MQEVEEDETLLSLSLSNSQTLLSDMEIKGEEGRLLSFEVLDFWFFRIFDFRDFGFRGNRFFGIFDSSENSVFRD